MNGRLLTGYKLAVFEILRDFCISIYCMSTLSLHIESTDSMIESRDSTFAALLHLGILYCLAKMSAFNAQSAR